MISSALTLIIAVSSVIAKPTSISGSKHDCLITFCSDDPVEQQHLAKHDVSYTIAHNKEAAIAWNACPDRNRIALLPTHKPELCKHGKLYGWTAATARDPHTKVDACTGPPVCVKDPWGNNGAGVTNCRPHVCMDFEGQGYWNLPGGKDGQPGAGSASTGVTARIPKTKKVA